MYRNLLVLTLLLFPFFQNLFAEDDTHPLILEIREAMAEQPNDGLSLLQAALETFEKNDDLANWIVACKDVGVEFDYAGDLTAAMNVYGMAVQEKLFRQPKSAEEWEALGWLYANAGFTLFYAGKYFECKPWYEKAHRIFEEEVRTLDTTDVAYVHRELGNIYTRFGDFEGALLLLERTQQVALEHGNFNLAAEASSDMGIAYFSQGRHEQAIDICRQALNYPQLGIVPKALLESQLAGVYAQIDERKTALEHARSAEALLTEIVVDSIHPQGPLWLSDLRKLQGELLEETAAARAALDHSQQLLQQIFPDTMRREFAKLRMVEAGFHLKHDRPEEALRHQQTALRSVLYRFTETDPKHNPDPSHFYPENVILEALAGKAASFQALYEDTGEQDWLESALACYDLIFEAERAYRQVHHFESSKLTLLEESSRRTESAMEAAWQMHQDFGTDEPLERAFGFSEKSKSILLYEALRHSGASSIANVPDSLLIQERRLREALAETEKNLFFKEQKKDASGLDELNLRMLDLTASINSLVQKMEEEHPAFYQEKYGESAISIAEVQSLLRPGQALVEYFVGDSSIFIFLVKNDDLHVERVPKDFPLEQWVADFREGIEAFQFSSNNRDSLCQSYTGLGQQLYQKLLQPIGNQQLPNDLIIIPGGILGFLPFDALLTEAPSANCIFKKYPYLVRRHNVSYCYSSTLLKVLREKRTEEAEASFAGFAPAFAEGNSSGFGRLKFNIESVQEIGKLLGGQSFIRTDASKRNFEENAANFRMLYLSTHAKANTDEGNFSFVVLAGSNPPLRGGRAGYDTLFVNDIYNLPPLLAELVFLGACETGSGKWYDGEGIISLARSFLYAGSRSIVTTLWSINDESNKQLTFRFFENLNAGQAKDEALRNAKLELLASDRPDLYAHPVYWAAYTPIGNMEPVKGRFPWWLVGVGVAGLGGVFFWRRRL